MHSAIPTLLRSRRFCPFFLTQLLGAFNDNLFRQALIVLIGTGIVSSLSINTLNNIGLALFILPFFLLSPIAGQLADKHDKSRLIRQIKLAEVILMAMAAVCFVHNAVWGLMLLLFCMGTQSAFFGPIKYSILPQQLRPAELTAGNALVEMGTFMAILLGSVSGVVLKMNQTPSLHVAVAIILVALLGYLAAWAIPQTPAANPGLKLDWNLWRQLDRTLRQARQNQDVWLSIIAISWFWFLGACYTTQLKGFTQEILRGDDGVYALLLGTFSVGVGMGSLLCNRLSANHIEPGLIIPGSLGLTLFGTLLFVVAPQPGRDAYLSIHEWLNMTTATSGSFINPNLGLLICLAGLGIAGGLYIVPLFAMIQTRCQPERLSRMIAANNILNALFITLAAIAGLVLTAALSVSIPVFFFILAMGNLAFACWITWQNPELITRFLLWCCFYPRYEIRDNFSEQIPLREPVSVLVTSSHLWDALLVAHRLDRQARIIFPDKQGRHWPIRLLSLLQEKSASPRVQARVVLDTASVQPDSQTFSVSVKPVKRAINGHKTWMDHLRPTLWLTATPIAPGSPLSTQNNSGNVTEKR